MARTTWSTLILVTFLVCGCGSEPKMYVINGTVTYDGVPVAMGEVSMVPEEPGIAPDGAVIDNGRFTIKAKPGKKLVMIRGSRVMANPPKGADLSNPPREDFIPAKYNTNTILKEEVGPDSPKELVFNLTSK